MKGERRVKGVVSERRTRPSIVDLERTLYVLQYRAPASIEWETVPGPMVEGRSSAEEGLSRLKAQRPDLKWRAEPKALAEKYAEGKKDGRGEKASWKNPLQVALPFLKKLG